MSTTDPTSTLADQMERIHEFALPRPLLSLLRAGVLLSLTATAAAAQTEFPHAAGTDATGRAQAVSDAAGRVLIESPEFPRGLWVDLVDEAGQALAGIQVEYEGWPDSLVAVHCVDPSGVRQETLLWTRPGGDPLRLVLKPSETADLPAGLTPVDWRVDTGAEELPVLEEGPELTGWPAVTAFLEERWRGRTGRVAVQIDGSPVVAVDLDHAEPVERLLDHLQDRARMSLGEIDHSVVQVHFDGRTFESDLALLEGAILLTTSVVLIRGSELERWILRDFGGGREGPVTWSEAAALTQLTLVFNEITIVDVGPLAALTGLERLNLWGNQIVDVGPLAPLTSLKELWLGDNAIVDVSPLAALTNLERLGLSENRIVDAGPLAPLTSLNKLWLGDNAIVDVSPLAALTNLERLEVSENRIVDVGPLASLASLEWLELGHNAIADVGPLVALTNLEGLGLGHNAIVDVGPLASLTDLQWLELGSNAIVDVSSLAALTNLERLWLDGNPLDVSSLAGSSSLRELWLGDDQIVDVSPLASLTSLETLRLDGIPVNVSSLAGLTSLRFLWLADNEIVDVSSLAGLTSLEFLWLVDNEIVDVSSLADLTRLESLGLSGNQIVDISSLAALTSLSLLLLHNNQIQDISPLVANTGLGKGDIVSLRDNPLSDRAINEQIPALKARGVDFVGGVEVRW